jgi:hypothetical protein
MFSSAFQIYYGLLMENIVLTLVLIEVLIVAQRVKNSPTFMELEGSLPYSQELAIGPYPESNESSPYLHVMFL